MNTRSSTKTEHIDTSEYLPKPMFFKLFMEAHSYKPNMILAKENESKIWMLVNGKASCISNSKHVAIKKIGAQIASRQATFLYAIVLLRRW